MTVKNLIHLLEQFPPDTKVVVAGYEGGYNDISSVKTIQLKTDAHTVWWYGQHDEVEPHEPGKPAVLLEGKNLLAGE